MAENNENRKLPFWELIRPGTTEQTEQVFKTFKAKADARRTLTERELTKVLKMLAAISEKHGIDVAGDLELKKMLKTVSAEKLEKSLGKEIQP